MKTIAALAAALAAAALLSCAWDSPTNLEKPAPGYPCGTGGHVCSNGACCGNVFACGGTPGCPAGSCCFVGEAHRLDAGLE